MQYTEQDTERARQAESVAERGLAAPVQNVAQRSRTLLAFGLIAAGALWLLNALGDSVIDLSAGYVLLTIASGFLFFAFWRKIYPLLIPGAILAGLSLGVTFADITNGASILFGLGIGFASLLPIGQLFFGVRHTWPAIPAVILIAIGTIVVATSAPLGALGVLWFPLLLVGAGVALGLRR